MELDTLLMFLAREESLQIRPRTREISMLVSDSIPMLYSKNT